MKVEISISTETITCLAVTGSLTMQ